MDTLGKVLLVDDDPHVLSALERVLRKENYHLLKAESGQDALKLIKEHDLSVIVCDQHMPRITGIDVCREAAQLRPDAERIILTGVQDLDTIVQAINVGKVSQYLLKPWDDTSLRHVIRSAVEKFVLVRENQALHKKNLMQHQELLKTHANLRRELEVGAQIHDLLLVSDVPPTVAGVKIDTFALPSHHIDGDFRSIIKPADHILDVVVGDVMGKGLPAALVGTAVKMQLGRFAVPFAHPQVFDRVHCWAEDFLGPREILNNVHQELISQLVELGFFVTLFYGRFDWKRQTFCYIDCGAAKPLRYEACSGVISELQGANYPLGVSQTEVYQEFEISFEPGDFFVFYSDGVTETRTPEGELYGVERLQSLITDNAHLSSESLQHVIHQSVVAFGGKEELDDDLTLVVVKIDPTFQPESTSVKSAKFFRDLSQLSAVRDFVHNMCLQVPGDAEELTQQLQLAINETFCNIVEHGKHDKHDEQGQSGCEVVIAGEHTPEGVWLEVADRGEPFNPSQVEEPSLAGDKDHGFGLYIIRRIADCVTYIPKKSDNGWNRLQIYKKYL